MACLSARVFSRRCSSAASSASISLSTSAMDLFGDFRNGHLQFGDVCLTDSSNFSAHRVEKELLPDGRSLKAWGSG